MDGRYGTRTYVGEENGRAVGSHDTKREAGNRGVERVSVRLLVHKRVVSYDVNDVRVRLTHPPERPSRQANRG